MRKEHDDGDDKDEDSFIPVFLMLLFYCRFNSNVSDSGHVSKLNDRLKHWFFHVDVV